jgi:hypothetical protein
LHLSSNNELVEDLAVSTSGRDLTYGVGFLEVEDEVKLTDLISAVIHGKNSHVAKVSIQYLYIAVDDLQRPQFVVLG